MNSGEFFIDFEDVLLELNQPAVNVARTFCPYHTCAVPAVCYKTI